MGTACVEYGSWSARLPPRDFALRIASWYGQKGKEKMGVLAWESFLQNLAVPEIWSFSP